MDAELINACEAFSTGNGPEAFGQMADDIQWHIIGDHSILGLEGVKHECNEALKEGLPNFENHRTILGEHCIVVEGSDVEADVHYCDIYSIVDGQISEIASYCMTAAEEE
ncbi:MAG: nuclear transport factor 2 family protein [Coraliomargarita sp.]